jgi:hypothetical protein
MELTDKQLDLLSAALRHVADAEALASEPGHTSLDQAYHLAGYGPECARKALLSSRAFDKSIGHRFLRDDVISWAAALELTSLRYDLEGWGARFPALAAWQEDVRYERTGTREEATVRALIASSREAVDDVLLSLWLDGRFPPTGVPK